jgi:hypothetical protein
MSDSAFQGAGEILQGNTPIGQYHYEFAVADQGKKAEPYGVIYVGDKANVFSSLVGSDLVLRLEDGSVCGFRIKEVARRMKIDITKPPN